LKRRIETLENERKRERRVKEEEDELEER